MESLKSCELRSLVREDGGLELSIASAPVPEPGLGEVVVRVEAAPVNPTDLAVLLASADLSRLGTAAEFGSLVKHICENDYLNGCILRLDGGMRVPFMQNIGRDSETLARGD